MTDAPPAVFSAPSATRSDVGTVLVRPSAPAAPPGFYTVPTLYAGNVGAVLATPSAPAAPIAPPDRTSPSPANAGSVLATPSAPAAPPGFYTVPTLYAGNVGAVLATPSAPAAPIAPPDRTAPSPGNVGSVVLPALEARATVTVGNITWTAVAAGIGGNELSIQILGAEYQARTDVVFEGGRITITPGAKSRMHINGSSLHDKDGSPLTDITLIYAGIYNGNPHWTEDGSYYDGAYSGWAIYEASGRWYVSFILDEVTYFQSHTETFLSYPSDCTYPSNSQGTGFASVSAFETTKEQIISIANAAVGSFVLATAAGDVTGASSSCSAYLTGGTGSATPITPVSVR